VLNRGASGAFHTVRMHSARWLASRSSKRIVAGTNFSEEERDNLKCAVPAKLYLAD